MRPGPEPGGNIQGWRSAFPVPPWCLNAFKPHNPSPRRVPVARSPRPANLARTPAAGGPKIPWGILRRPGSRRRRFTTPAETVWCSGVGTPSASRCGVPGCCCSAGGPSGRSSIPRVSRPRVVGSLRRLRSRTGPSARVRWRRGGGDSTRDVTGVWALDLATASWESLAVTGPEPPPRDSHSAIYVSAADEMILFGGGGDGGLLNDAWALTLGDEPQWRLIQAAGTPPSPRARHSAIYDPVGNRMVIFGGASYFGEMTNDVWALSLGSAPEWTQLEPSGTPPSARAGHRAVYDPVRRSMLVFGGYQSGDKPYGSDLWEMTLSGAPEWHQIAALGSSPGGRFAPDLVFDGRKQRIVLCGGTERAAGLDVWSFGSVVRGADEPEAFSIGPNPFRAGSVALVLRARGGRRHFRGDGHRRTPPVEARDRARRSRLALDGVRSWAHARSLLGPRHPGRTHLERAPDRRALTWGERRDPVARCSRRNLRARSPDATLRRRRSLERRIQGGSHGQRSRARASGGRRGLRPAHRAGRRTHRRGHPVPAPPSSDPRCWDSPPDPRRSASTGS